MLRRALFPCLAILLAVTATAGARPTAHAAKNCSLSSAEQGGSNPSTLGPTYVFPPIKARHVSCGKAKKLVKAFHTCRHKHGKAGHCAHVKGYHCTEKRTTSPTQYDSTATCKRGSKKIVHKYTQNT